MSDTGAPTIWNSQFQELDDDDGLDFLPPVEAPVPAPVPAPEPEEAPTVLSPVQLNMKYANPPGSNCTDKRENCPTVVLLDDKNREIFCSIAKNMRQCPSVCYDTCLGAPTQPKPTESPTFLPSYITDTMPPKDEGAVAVGSTVEFPEHCDNTKGAFTYGKMEVKTSCGQLQKVKIESRMRRCFYFAEYALNCPAICNPECALLNTAPADSPKAETDETDAPTYIPTDTHHPTWSPSEPVETLAPTRTHYPTWFTSTEQPQPKITLKPTFEDSQEDSYSQTQNGVENDTAPTPANPSPTPQPTFVSLPEVIESTSEFKVLGENKAVGFQSNWGTSYAGSMTYDFTRNAVYVTGTSMAANPENPALATCFVGELSIEDKEKYVEDDAPKPSVLDANPEQAMNCNVILQDEAKEEVLHIAGALEEKYTARKGKINGFLNTYERTRTQPNWALNMSPVATQNPSCTADQKKQGLCKTNPAATKWPVAMVPGVYRFQETYDIVHMLTVSSEEGLLTEEFIENGDAKNLKNERNVLMPPGHQGGDPDKFAIPKRGENYYMSYQEYKYDNAGNLVFEKGEDLPVQGKQGSIIPTGLINLDPNGRSFIYAGHFKGGRAPRRFMFPDRDYGSDVDSKDFDGFVTNIRFPQSRPSFYRETNVRFNSIERNPPLDDMIHGICKPPGSEKDGKSLTYYVVGSTYGTMEDPVAGKNPTITTNILKGDLPDGNAVPHLSAWVAKVDTRKKNERSIVWLTQLYATIDNKAFENGMAEAFGCHVIDADKSKIYVGGTVYNGGIMDSNHKSNGGDDVWVAQLRTEDGSLRWIRQIGSAGKDHLAHTNGIDSDINGHAIIYGNTDGEMFRRKQKKNSGDGSGTDVFVTTLDYNTGASSQKTIAQQGGGKAVTATLVTLSVLAVVVCALFVLKWKRAQKYASKNTDGVLSLGKKFSFREKAGEPNLNSASASFDDTDDSPRAPPSDAFGNSGSKNGMSNFV